MTFPVTLSSRTRVADTEKSGDSAGTATVTSKRQGYVISLSQPKKLAKLLVKVAKKVVRGAAALVVRLKGGAEAPQAAPRPALRVSMPKSASVYDKAMLKVEMPSIQAEMPEVEESFVSPTISRRESVASLSAMGPNVEDSPASELPSALLCAPVSHPLSDAADSAASELSSNIEEAVASEPSEPSTEATVADLPEQEDHIATVSSEPADPVVEPQEVVSEAPVVEEMPQLSVRELLTRYTPENMPGVFNVLTATTPNAYRFGDRYRNYRNTVFAQTTGREIVVGTVWENDSRPLENSSESIRALLNSGRYSVEARALALSEAMGDVPARPLEMAVADWYPKEQQPEIAELWREYAKEYPKEAKDFSKFLDKLKKHSSAQLVSFKEFVRSWLSELSASPELRKETYFSAHEATKSCQDRMGLTFNEMQGYRIDEGIRRGDYDNIKGLVPVLRNVFRLQCLEQFGAKRMEVLVEREKENLGPFMLARMGNNTYEVDAAVRKRIDEVEVFLALPMKLRGKLSLEVGILGMEYGSALKDEDFIEAEEDVKKRENAEFAVWFENSHQWDALLQRRYPEEQAEFAEQRRTGVDKALETIDADIDAEIKARGLPDVPEARHHIGKEITDKVEEDLKRVLTQKILKRHNCSAMLAPVWEIAVAPKSE